jgi:hypothetical protein
MKMSSINRSYVKEKLEEIEALTEIKRQFHKENFKKELTGEKAFDVFVITFLGFLVSSVLILMSIVVFNFDIFSIKEKVSDLISVYSALGIFSLSFVASSVFMVFYTLFYNFNKLHNKKIINNYNFIFNEGEDDVNKCKYIINELISDRKRTIINNKSMIEEMQSMLKEDFSGLSLNTSLIKNLIKRHQRVFIKNKDTGFNKKTRKRRTALKIVENF